MSNIMHGLRKPVKDIGTVFDSFINDIKERGADVVKIDIGFFLYRDLIDNISYRKGKYPPVASYLHEKASITGLDDRLCITAVKRVFLLHGKIIYTYLPREEGDNQIKVESK